MHDYRATWTHVGNMLAANAALPSSHWWQFMRDTYATTQAVAVRRQADRHRDAGSLGALLHQLSDDCGRITEEFWVEKWVGAINMRQMGRRFWAEQFGGKVGAHLDPEIVLADVGRLEAGSARVRLHVDKRIAHSDAKAKPEALANLSDVHDAIEVIGQIFSRYYNLFTAASFTQLEPVIQYDWMAVFRVPWMAQGWRG